jgi:hypothetical protein
MAYYEHTGMQHENELMRSECTGARVLRETPLRYGTKLLSVKTPRFSPRACP